MSWQKDNIIIFAKQIGYSIVLAKIIQNKSNFKLEMELLVKNTDGEILVYTSKKNTLENIKNNEEYYLNVMQIIMDFEDSILGWKFAWEINRNKIFDFRENTKFLNEYIFSNIFWLLIIDLKYTIIGLLDNEHII